MSIVTTFKLTVQERVGLMPLALGLAVVIMFMLYMWQLTIATTAGYHMRALEDEIAVLRQDIVRTNTRIAELQSVDSVTGRMKMLGLVPAKEVNYIVTGSSNVAINR